MHDPCVLYRASVSMARMLMISEICGRGMWAGEGIDTRYTRLRHPPSSQELEGIILGTTLLKRALNGTADIDHSRILR